MEEYKLGQIVYYETWDKEWIIGHFAGMHRDYFRTAQNYTTALEKRGSGYSKCLSIEDYHKMLNAQKDKDLVWCWYVDNPFSRSIKFYDAKNNNTFYSGSGRRNGVCFDHYEVIDNWRNNPAFAWAVNVFESLED